MLRNLLVLALLLLVVETLASTPKCDSDSTVGQVCKIKAKNLKPTQFAYGRLASLCKAEYLESLPSSKLDDYLKLCVECIGQQSLSRLDATSLFLTFSEV